MSSQHATDAYTAAYHAHHHAAQGSPESAQTALAMALAAHAMALYDNADAFRAGDHRAQGD